jgi:hypothetical protein
MVSAGTMNVHNTPSLKVYVLLYGNTWGFFHPWIILASLLLKTWAQHQMKAKRSCNCIMTFWWYFFRKLNMLLQTSL